MYIYIYIYPLQITLFHTTYHAPSHTFRVAEVGRLDPFGSGLGPGAPNHVSQAAWLGPISGKSAIPQQVITLAWMGKSFGYLTKPWKIHYNWRF